MQRIALEGRKMITAKFAATLMTLTLLWNASAAAEQSTIEQHIESGRPVALFKVGDSSCRLVDDQIRCTRIRN